MRKVPIILFITAAILLSAPAQAQVTLKASHQFPGGKGDPRDEMVQIIAREAKAANVGLDIQVYPGASLFKPNDQWNAMVNGQLDISSFPLDYASGKVARLQRHADAGPRAQPRPRRAAQRLAVHEGHQGEDRQGRRHRARRRLARRRCRLQEGLHPQAGGHQGPEDPLGRPDLRGHVAAGRRFDRLDPARTKSTTRCRPASRRPPTPRPAASSRSASTSR